MDRFRRKIRQKLKESQKPFEVWYREQAGESAGRSEEGRGAVKVKKRIGSAVWLIAAAVAFIMLVTVVAVALGGRQQTAPQIPDLTFGEESVISTKMDEADVSETMADIPPLKKISNVSGRNSYYIVDNSPVMTIISGEMHTQTDFYLITARIIYNNNFIFLDWWEYQDLPNSFTVGDTSIYYKSFGKNDSDMQVFFATTETDGVLIYWEVSCFQGQFSEWGQAMFG